MTKPRTKGHGLPPKYGTGEATAARKLRDERVDHIVGMMVKGEWFGARSTRDRAAAWGLSYNAVEDYGREASGVVRRVINGNPEEVRAEILAGVEQIRHMAQKGLIRYVRTGSRVEGKAVVPIIEAVPEPQLETALRALDMRMRAFGLYPAEKLKVTLPGVGDAEPTNATERHAQLVAIKKELDEEIAAAAAAAATEPKGTGTIQ